jgi:hypothetical protein
VLDLVGRTPKAEGYGSWPRRKRMRDTRVRKPPVSFERPRRLTNAVDANACRASSAGYLANQLCHRIGRMSEPFCFNVRATFEAFFCGIMRAELSRSPTAQAPQTHPEHPIFTRCGLMTLLTSLGANLQMQKGRPSLGGLGALTAQRRPQTGRSAHCGRMPCALLD